MIIVEGPDGSGKTTLAKKLADDLGLEYRRPPQSILDSSRGPVGVGILDWWAEELIAPEEEKRKRIYDRCFFISEAIYQLAHPARPLLVNGHWYATQIITLWAEDLYMIFCAPPFEVQLSVVKAEGRNAYISDEGVLEKIDFMYWAYYGMWMNAIHGNVTTYDYTKDDAYESIKNWLTSMEGARNESE